MDFELSAARCNALSFFDSLAMEESACSDLAQYLESGLRVMAWMQRRRMLDVDGESVGARFRRRSHFRLRMNSIYIWCDSFGGKAEKISSLVGIAMLTVIGVERCDCAGSILEVRLIWAGLSHIVFISANWHYANLMTSYYLVLSIVHNTVAEGFETWSNL